MKRFGLIQTCGVVLGASLLAGICLPSSNANAGYRPLEVLGSNMTPDDDSTEASKKCVSRIRNVLSTHDVTWNHIGETALRDVVGAQDKSVSFMTWSGSQLSKARQSNKGNPRDAVLLIDCRPEEKHLDILIGTGDDGVVSIQLRDTTLSVERLTWVATEVNRQAWVNFSP